MMYAGEQRAYRVSSAGKIWLTVGTIQKSPSALVKYLDLAWAQTERVEEQTNADHFPMRLKLLRLPPHFEATSVRPIRKLSL
jgi:hypothetical protein